MKTNYLSQTELRHHIELTSLSYDYDIDILSDNELIDLYYNKYNEKIVIV